MAMYDRNLDYHWHIDIEFDEDHTHNAYRHPKDAVQLMIGEEIAAARGLIALGTELLQSASTQIEKATHRPVHLYS